MRRIILCLNSYKLLLFLSEKKMASPSSSFSSTVTALKLLFLVLECLILSSVLYTLITDGLPFRKELLTPWMAATLIDFYIDIIPVAVWVAYKESHWVGAALWIILLICFGSITTCTYILVQLFKLSSHDPHDPFPAFLLRSHSRTAAERKRNCSSVVTARVLFIALGCLMLASLLYTLLTDGSPFRQELLTPWLVSTLLDFYVNIVAIAVWVAYKEAAWISAFIWIVLLICFGSITTCFYIVIQLFQISSQASLYLVLLNTPSRKQSIKGY